MRNQYKIHFSSQTDFRSLRDKRQKMKDVNLISVSHIVKNLQRIPFSHTWEVIL